MKERPVLFSTEMVKAILNGHKTMTRRVLKGIGDAKANEELLLEDCPYGQVGDRLWVKEALMKEPDYSWCKEGYAVYKADGKQVTIGGAGIEEGVPWQWKKDVLPSIFMPRWASRIILEITNIRIERLQDITPVDAVNEGAEYMPAANLQKQRLAVSQIVFAGFWDKLNAKRGYSWQSNPWVWVIEFKKI